MRQIFRWQTLRWALYAIALFLIYHLLIKIAVLDLSWIALLVLIPVLFLGYFLFRPQERRQGIVFTIGFLLLDRALTSLDVKSLVMTLVGGLIAILVIALVTKWYGKLAWNAVFALVLIAVLTNVSFNRDNLAALNHFYIKWESDRLYQGEWVDYFPITLYDVDGDGKQEIITYGNKDEVPEPEEQKKPETEEERQALAEKLLPLKPEMLSLYVYTMKNGQMVRIPSDQIPADKLVKIKEQLPVDYPGFPYYTMKDNQLVPNVQRQSYAESMLQVGTAPYRAFLLDMINVEQLLKDNQGKMDHRFAFEKETKFKDLSIEAGQLSGTYDGKPFTAPTKATKLINTMTLPDGREGLIVMGEHLSVLAVEPDGSVKEAYTLTRKQVALSTAQIIVADVDHDKQDELLIGGSPSYILKPLSNGTWDVLWVSQDKKSFRLTNHATVGKDSEPQLVAQAKSWISSYDRRYLAGFDYTPEGLVQKWKIYLPLMNIQVGDVDGDKENEIVASIYDTHRLLILKQHTIPVLPIVIVLFAGLIVYGVVRRFRHA